MLLQNILSIVSLITIIIIFTISMVCLWKMPASFVQNDQKDLDWGLIIAYSALFGFLSGSLVLIIGIQVIEVKQRKQMNPYKSKMFRK